MSRYIDADALSKTLATVAKRLAKSDAQKALMGRVFYIIDHWSEDAAPVMNGRWLKSVDTDTGCEMHRCSICGAGVVKGLYEYENPNRYCYCCGAKMDGGDQV